MDSGLFQKLRSMFSSKSRGKHSAEEIERARECFAHADISEEARQRKYRSEAILQSEGVPINLFLPVVETEAEMKHRTKEEVAFRTMTLLIVASRGEGLEQAQAERLIAGYGLGETLTPQEQAFLDDPAPTAESCSQFCWRYEAAWTLLWALSFAEKLNKPATFCDAGRAVRLLKERGREQFIADAQLRSPAEILDQADLIYRYDWAVVDARMHGKPMPAGLEAGITVERHHALNWLVGYNDAEWDDVTTDT